MKSDTSAGPTAQPTTDTTLGTASPVGLCSSVGPLIDAFAELTARVPSSGTPSGSLLHPESHLQSLLSASHASGCSHPFSALRRMTQPHSKMLMAPNPLLLRLPVLQSIFTWRLRPCRQTSQDSAGRFGFFSQFRNTWAPRHHH